VQAYLRSLTKDVEVTDEEVRNFFESNKDMMGDNSFDQIKDRIREYVLEQKQNKVIQAHMNSLSDRYEVEVDRDWVAKQYEAATNNPVDKARRSGKPSLVDFGAGGCRPCDMMKPILESLSKTHADKFNVVVIDVRKEQVLADRYGVRLIPVQIFFDKDGREIFRHEGFLPMDQILAKFAEIGVK
jgi:thioredoxin 1